MKTSCLASGMDPITPLDYPPEHALAAFRTLEFTPVQTRRCVHRRKSTFLVRLLDRQAGDRLEDSVDFLDLVDDQ